MQVILNVNYVSHIAALIKASGCRVYFLNDGFVVIAIIIDIFIIIIEDITLMAPVRRLSCDDMTYTGRKRSALYGSFLFKIK